MKKTVIVMPVANEESTMENVLKEITQLPYDELYIYPVFQRSDRRDYTGMGAKDQKGKMYLL